MLLLSQVILLCGCGPPLLSLNRMIDAIHIIAIFGTQNFTLELLRARSVS